MFDLLKFQNKKQISIEDLYSQIFEQSRHASFYTEYGVPDTVDGRFDMLLMHIYMVMQRLVGQKGASKKMAQGLFDMTFADMDQSLRQQGVGDMGVPKHMRRMMKAFNGRMYAYRQAMKDGTMEQAVERNIFGTIETPAKQNVDSLTHYMQTNIDHVNAQDLEEILQGHVDFIAPKELKAQDKKYG